MSNSKFVLTNRFNLPDTIVRAVEYDNHKVAGDISVTQLISPPQMRMLRREADQIVEDVSDKLWALLGTALHAVLERSAVAQQEVHHFLSVIDIIRDRIERADINDEQTVASLQQAVPFLEWVISTLYPNYQPTAEIERTISMSIGGYQLYGTRDYFIPAESRLQDYKLMPVSQHGKIDVKAEFKKQLNIYAYMTRKNGQTVNAIDVIAIYRDWSKAQSKFKANYPPCAVEVLPIPLMRDEEIENYILERLNLHHRAEQGEYIPCTNAEKWEKPTQWAVKSKGRKQAVRVLPTQAQAESYLKTKTIVNGYIEKRAGNPIRCESYCPVSGICPQYANYLEEQRRAESGGQKNLNLD